ncbi:hypothetical protein J3R83DRAFT_13269 [Lanmaoa asiatica]|nr:hypothetical protein J3R83DRAFT_13269 [Lanmaoa asiatica]
MIHNLVDPGRIHFPKAGADDLAALYAACKPAHFGRNKETVLDDTYRKAKKIDLDSFSMPFDLHSLGILEQVSSGLLTGKRGPGITEMELYKLNVYGEGDFFKPQQDTPRSESMVGSLVVVLPTQHEGGRLVLRQGTQEWILDFADKLSAATDPLVCFVAFFGDVGHGVLPITSGYRVTLTYNMRLKKVLVNFINDKSTLPQGGYLGCGLVHEYVYDADQPINALLDHLKGADQVLAMICEELGLQHSLTLLYRGLGYEDMHLIAREAIDLGFCSSDSSDETGQELLGSALWNTTIDNIEGVEIIGHLFNHEVLDVCALRRFYRNPTTKILEIWPVSSVNPMSPTHITGTRRA